MKKLLKLSGALIVAGLILYFVGAFFGGAENWPQWASFTLPSSGARQSSQLLPDDAAFQSVSVQGNTADITIRTDEGFSAAYTLPPKTN